MNEQHRDVDDIRVSLTEDDIRRAGLVLAGLGLDAGADEATIKDVLAAVGLDGTLTATPVNDRDIERAALRRQASKKRAPKPRAPRGRTSLSA